MIVGIASGVIETLVAEAAAAAPNECCGLLLGRPGRIAAIAVAANVAAHPERAFEIDPATLLRVHREARGAGHAIVGHYHSHPDGSPQPSLRDAARAVENAQIWLIIAGSMVHAWHVVGDDPGGSALHGRFLPVTLEVD
jgi:proteasome lid subunit RPN8/RPN11